MTYVTDRIRIKKQIHRVTNGHGWSISVVISPGLVVPVDDIKHQKEWVKIRLVNESGQGVGVWLTEDEWENAGK